MYVGFISIYDGNFSLRYVCIISNITKQYFSRLSVSLIIQLYEIQSVKAAEFKWKLNEPIFSVELPSDEFSSWWVRPSSHSPSPPSLCTSSPASSSSSWSASSTSSAWLPCARASGLSRKVKSCKMCRKNPSNFVWVNQAEKSLCYPESRLQFKTN